MLKAILFDLAKRVLSNLSNKFYLFILSTKFCLFKMHQQNEMERRIALCISVIYSRKKRGPRTNS